MRIFFLEARVPLTKKFTASQKHPYPNAFEFKSHSHIVKDLPHFTDLLKVHASLGHCLLKGELDRDLEWESRATRTNPNAETRWICLDLDGVSSVPDIETFMQKIGLGHVSYIVQWSASYGINGDFTLRAHVFVLLKAAVAPMVLKTWLKQLNLATFQNDLSLTKTHVSLRWGVDTTTCQNDKLIYIAPPHCEPPSINKFAGERISLVQKKADFFDFGNVTLVVAEQLRKMEEEQINRLRATQGMPERKATQFKLKELKGEHYLPNPDQATVTSIKEERGFVYLNLNGGDSWGYYHPTDNATFIYNFKGEPTYKTSELVPDYWHSFQAAKKGAVKAANTGKLFLAFRDMRTANYYNGWYDQATGELVLYQAKSERQLEDFLTNYGQPVPESIPIWHLVYEPFAPPIDLATQTVNLFRESQYMRHAVANAKTAPAASKEQFPVIRKIISHVFGESLVDHYLNWLAFSFVKREAPGTAFVTHGIQGTGKGLLQNKIVTPLFGINNVTVKRMEQLEDKFNDYLENTLQCFIDEAQISDSGRNRMIMANLKNYITEPRISVRRMHSPAYDIANRAAWTFASNMADPVSISGSDRRFNVGEYQPTKLEITDAEIAQITSELNSFALYLQQLNIDVEAVRTPVQNEAKEQMVLVSRSSADTVADALIRGRIDQLWDSLPQVDESLLDPGTQAKLAPYKQVLYDLVLNKRNKIKREELFILFNYNVGNVNSSPHKLTTYFKHHGLHIKDVWINGRTSKGFETTWTVPDAWFDEKQAEIAIERQPHLAVVKTLKQA